MFNVEETSVYKKPWILIDCICSIDDKSIVTKKLISYSDRFIEGHFPGRSVYPGMLLLEGITQSIEILVAKKKSLIVRPELSEYSVRFIKQVIPGDTVIFHINLKNEGIFDIFKAIGTVNDEVIIKANIKAKTNGGIYKDEKQYPSHC